MTVRALALAGGPFLAYAPLLVLALATTSLPLDYIHPRPAARSFFGLPARNPWVAGSLSLALDGGGQFYNGQPTLGWWLLAPDLAYPLAWGADTLMGSSSLRLMDLALILGSKGYSIWQAYHQDATRSFAHP